MKKSALGKVLLIALAFSAVLTIGCRKEKFSDKGSLSFSTDTLSFDTVFTTLPSTTRFFKVYNNERLPIKISSIRLLELQSDASFRLNVDGIPGKIFRDVEILGNDSLYVFVETTVKNPLNPNNPFVIYDAVEFIANGNRQVVTLEVWGQDAYYHKGEIYRYGENITWKNDKPHVILQGSFPGVGVDSGATLNIQSGTKIFVGSNAALWVYGTLNAQANSCSDSIVFRGLRLEKFYRDKPAQWWGIIFGRNKDLEIARLNLKRVVVTETFFGIADEYIFNAAFQQNVLPINLAEYSINGAPELNLKQCIIKHAQNTALFALNAKVNAENCIFHTTGSNVVALALGGEHHFNHCTIYNTGGRFLQHKQEALLIADKILANNILYAANLKANVTNSVVYGSLENEFRFADEQDKIRFENCLIKLRQDTANKYSSKFIQCIFNKDPKFKNAAAEDFTPSDSLNSPLIDAGKFTGLSSDIFDKPRNTPDIGAVEGK
ncbi:MAG: hypothetical protein RMJ53_00595 [Chitinophagales bacterium]|nr:hypothetical protein [Chitinophagales bacterium]MDW8272709.1 hypothetical protein [Chitinophagales bacterium]